MHNGLIKLGDFGISRVLDKTKELAKTMVGTPYYLSPEILAEQGYGFKSDIWSLGVVLYEMTTLKHPFDAGNLHSLALRIMKGDFEDPNHSAYSRDTRLLIRSMLKQIPEARPNINHILGAPIMQKPIAAVVAKYPELQTCNLSHEDLDETVVPLNVLPEEPSVMLGDVVVHTLQNLSVSSKGSAASTVKYSVEDAYSADFEAYSTDSEASTYREEDSIDDLSNPAGIFCYVCNRVGEIKATLLFAMIQRRVDAAADDAEVETFRDEAQQLIPDATAEELDHVLSLAEAAVFLQNAYNLSLLT
jgi:serine/threonine protein kinase